MPTPDGPELNNSGLIQPNELLNVLLNDDEGRGNDVDPSVQGDSEDQNLCAASLVPFHEISEIESAGSSTGCAELRCIFHEDLKSKGALVGGTGSSKLLQPDEPVRPFTKETFARAKVAAAARKSQKTSKYSQVVENFPQTLQNDYGYHRRCYSNFTAFSKAPNMNDEQTTTNDPRTETGCWNTRSALPCSSATSSGVLKRVCIFCRKEQKRINHKIETLHKAMTKDFEAKVRQDIEKLNDSSLRAFVGTADFVASEVHYHNSCRKKYARRAHENHYVHDDLPTLWRKKRQDHRSAFNALCDFIKQEVIINENILSMSELRAQYIALLEEDGSDETNFMAHHLENKLIGHFGNVIDFVRSGEGKSRCCLLYKVGIPQSKLIKARYNECLTDSNPSLMVKQVAYMLRKEIFKLKSKVSSNTVTDILGGDRETPALMKTFFESLIAGPSFSGSNASSKLTNLRISSMCDDAIYCTSKGLLSPHKHTALGLAVKSMTGSKQLIQILNRFGHIINYNKIEELETAMADAITSERSSIPDGIERRSGLSTYTAFDNYDEFCDSFDGANSLHETVGICYQVKQECSDSSPKAAGACIPRNPKQNKKRKFTFEINVLEPYSKKPKMSTTFVPLETGTSPSYHDGITRDSIWLLSVAYGGGMCPMWVGYNSATVEDPQPQHQIAYLKNYDQSSTSPSMVLETLKVAEQVAEECQQNYGVATYDLNIAKPAFQIRNDLAPRFDKVFVNFGSFHLFLAYFAALGKIISGSGGPEILTESGVIGPSSLRGFLKGKHYNRCKRIHPIFAAALNINHLELFEELEGPFDDGVVAFLRRTVTEPELLKDIAQLPNEVTGFVKQYEEFSEKTRQGQHGATAQFWLNYIDLVRLWLLLYRSVKMNDIELFTTVLPEVADVFFATNHINYARWMVAYHQQLLSIDQNYPGLKSEVKKNGGFLSLKRTNTPFSGTPIDQTLEQTVNRDAASRLTGTAAFNTHQGARLRWTVTRSARSRVVSAVKDMVYLNRNDDSSAELKPSRIARDNRDIMNIDRVIDDIINPFTSISNDDNLYNILTGKAATSPVRGFLLNFREEGKKARTEFLNQCIQDPTRFEAPLKRIKMETFENQSLKFQVMNSRRSEQVKKIKELKITTALFGRLCCLGLQKNIALEDILTYPLTPVPLSLADVDGSMRKTSKAALMNHIEKLNKPDSLPPDPKQRYDLYVVDGMFFLHTLPQGLPNTFGGLSDYIFKKLSTINADRIDICFDQYKIPSIKNVERERRDGQGLTHHDAYIIRGRDQKRPTNFHQALRSVSFKENLIKFLCEDWQHERHYSPQDRKKIFVAYNNVCYSFRNGELSYHPELESTHEEADTRMFFHVYTFLKESTVRVTHKKIMVLTSDTDVFTIFMGNMGKLGDLLQRSTIFMERRINSKQSKLISLSSIYHALGEPLASALPAYHAFTGCDYTAAFARKGKVKPFSLLRRNEHFQKAFASLGLGAEIPVNVATTLGRFVAEMYGQKTCSSIDEARIKFFLRNYAPPDDSNPFGKIKDADPANIPPCSNVLVLKIKRVNYVASIWRNAEKSNPMTLSTPTMNGWTFENGDYSLQWYEGNCLPEDLEDIIIDDDKLQIDEDEDEAQPGGNSESDDSETDDE